MGNYYKINLPERKYEPIYSIDEVEGMMREKIVGDELRTIFVSGSSMEDVEYRGDVIDFVMYGGELLIAFETFTLGLVIHGEGLMAYCILPAMGEMNPELLPEEIPDIKQETYYDLGEVYSKYDYGLKVFDMSFDTEEYPLFSMRNWDMDRIRASKKLPARLNLKVENLEIAFCGSTIEYFYIVMKSTD